MIIERSRKELKYREWKRKQISRKKGVLAVAQEATRTQRMRSSANNS